MNIHREYSLINAAKVVERVERRQFKGIESFLLQFYTWHTKFSDASEHALPKLEVAALEASIGEHFTYCSPDTRESMQLTKVLIPLDETVIINKGSQCFKFCRPIIPSHVFHKWIAHSFFLKSTTCIYFLFYHIKLEHGKAINCLSSENTVTDKRKLISKCEKYHWAWANPTHNLINTDLSIGYL